MRNKTYMVKSDEQLLIEEYLPLNQPEEQWGYITSTAICDYIFEVHQKSIKPRAVGRALTALGYEQVNTTKDGVKGRYYKFPFLKGYSLPF
ncbi:hypothetical protein H8718_20360 [Lachnospiraceae bacterium NSJ-12]|uniref:Uncharacterized protein n=3 Tax=Zhenhengia TaxID=2944196 RepID=A0A926EP27_9FIRM|nr:hypothetical protein [Zhenhengia yiwuensis]